MLQALLLVGDAPGSLAGYGLLVGLIGLLPLLFFWSFTAMDFNLRKNDGHGSSYILDWAKALTLALILTRTLTLTLALTRTRTRP